MKLEKRKKCPLYPVLENCNECELWLDKWRMCSISAIGRGMLVVAIGVAVLVILVGAGFATYLAHGDNVAEMAVAGALIIALLMVRHWISEATEGE